MIEIQGLSAVQGIGIGKPCFVPYQKRSISEYSIDKSDIASELKRFHVALKQVDEELSLLQDGLEKPNIEKANLIMAHRIILKDSTLQNTIENWLYEKLSNIESLLFRFSTNIEQTLKGLDNSMFAERSIDIQDVTYRIIDALLGYKRDDTLRNIKEDSIIFAYDLYPSDVVVINSQYIKGLVMEAGGVTSHTAILARSLGIPTVFGIVDLLYHFHEGYYPANCVVIVDSNKSKVIFDPDNITLDFYKSDIQQYNANFENYVNILQPQIKKNDQNIFLYANMGALNELEHPFLAKSSGIGLFRSEFLFLNKILNEEKQYKVYIKILKSVAPHQEVTIRTIDLGGDKMPEMGLLAEPNPLLGCRAIRLAMTYPNELFFPQIRAIYRAAAYAKKHHLGKIRMMLPMISSNIELLEAKRLIIQALEPLQNDGIGISDVPLGVMIELPSAALCSEIIAQDVDFFSIGTNDLVQYTLGIDRANEKLSYLYDPLQFGVLKLIKQTITSANNAGIPVSLCGEMASDRCSTAVLLGLGLRHFSMNTFSLPEIAYTIDNYNISDCEELAHRYISMDNYQKARQYLLDWHKERNVKINIREWE